MTFKASFFICLAILITIYFQFKIVQNSIESHNEDSEKNYANRHLIENVLLKSQRVSSISRQTDDGKVTVSFAAYSPVTGNRRSHSRYSSSSREYDDFGIQHTSEEPLMQSNKKIQNGPPPYKLFNERIGFGGKVYQAEFADDVRNLERSLVESKIVTVIIPSSGTQLKWEAVLEDGNRVMVKPMRFPRGYMTGRDWIGDLERHTSEIGAYHLDRILGFNRAPITVGRTINITREFRDLVTDQAFLKTFSIQNGEHCFYGVCLGPFCKPNKLICADHGLLEVSMTTYVFKPWHEEVNPWTFNPGRIETWQNTNICKDVLLNEFKGEERALLNLIDSCILDFLLRNYDRHAYAYFTDLGTAAIFLHYDHGKSFGNFTDDDLRILSPLTQCQRISNKTWTQLNYLSQPDRHIGDLMKASLSRDALRNILSDGHFEALNRRLNTVLLISKEYRKVDDTNVNAQA